MVASVRAEIVEQAIHQSLKVSMAIEAARDRGSHQKKSF
jgi:hypothetical protein